MALKRDYSEFQVEGLVGCPDHQPRNDPRLLERRAKNKKAIGGVYDNSSLYAIEYTPHIRAMLRQDCRNALNPGPVPLFERLAVEPHAVKVCDRIWMSDLYTATDGNVLRALKITHVVAIYGRQETRPLYPIGFKTANGEDLLFTCILWDEKEEPCISSKVLINTFRWITEALWEDNLVQGGSSGERHRNNVLIHSLMGCSRAALVALAMLAPSMEASMLQTSYQKLMTVRPSVSLTGAMNAGLDEFWATYAQEEDAKTETSDMPSLSLGDIFNATFPPQEQEETTSPGVTEQRREWWNGFGLPSSGVISRDGSLTYSAVFETPGANQAMNMGVEAPTHEGENETEGDEDDHTVVADANDAGNALLADLEREETLEALILDRRGMVPPAWTLPTLPIRRSVIRPMDMGRLKGRHEALFSDSRVTGLLYCCLHSPRGFLDLARRERFVVGNSWIYNQLES